MSTYSQDNDFRDALISNSLLEDAISWIAKNMSPSEVFDEKELASWATENGYVTKEEE